MDSEGVRTRAKPHTFVPGRLLRREMRAGIALDTPEWRPARRADCEDGPRPWVGCRHHLATNVTGAGHLQLVHPDTPVGGLPVSCALDVAHAGGITLEDIGALLNITKERARQIEQRAKQIMAGAWGKDAPGTRRPPDEPNEPQEVDMDKDTVTAVLDALREESALAGARVGLIAKEHDLARERHALLERAMDRALEDPAGVVVKVPDPRTPPAAILSDVTDDDDTLGTSEVAARMKVGKVTAKRRLKEAGVEPVTPGRPRHEATWRWGDVRRVLEGVS